VLRTSPARRGWWCASCPRLVVVLALGVLLSTAHAPAAVASDDHHGLSLGLRLGLGGAIVGRAADQPGQVTLLYGSGYTGSAVRVGLTGAYGFGSRFRVRMEAMYARHAAAGFAETDTSRRELHFAARALEFPVILEVFHQFGIVEPYAQVGLGPRFGLFARSEDRRFGFVVDEPGPEIRPGNALVGHFEVGVGFHAHRFRVPIGVRATRNLSYPGTTRGRVENPHDVSNPGRYTVDYDYTFLFTVGIDLAP